MFCADVWFHYLKISSKIMKMLIWLCQLEHTCSGYCKSCLLRGRLRMILIFLNKLCPYFWCPVKIIGKTNKTFFCFSKLWLLLNQKNICLMFMENKWLFRVYLGLRIVYELLSHKLSILLPKRNIKFIFINLNFIIFLIFNYQNVRNKI